MPAATYRFVVFAGLALLALPGSGCARTPTPKPAVGSAKPEAQAPPPKVIGEQGPMALLLSDLGSARAPSFVKRGLRLTFRVHTATVAGMGKDWKPDENGAWETDDGRRWRPEDKGSAAAEGLMQFDVIAVTPSEAAILAGFYLIPRPGAPPQLSFQYPIVGPASAAGGLWAPPDKLRAVQNRVTPSLKVQRMPCRALGASRPAVWIQSLSDRGNSIWVYDEETGVLLHDARSSTGKPSPVIGPLETSNTPSTTLADGTLLSRRPLDLPWNGETASDWAPRSGPLAYAGTSTVPTAGGAPLVLRQDMAVTPRDRGAEWVLFDTVLRTTSSIGMPPTTTPAQAISGLGQFGGVWLPPPALARLTRGQELDRDPFTGVRATVDAADRSQVVISAVNGAQALRWTYNTTTGAMVGIEKDDPTPLGRIRTRLTLKGR